MIFRLGGPLRRNNGVVLCPEALIISLPGHGRFSGLGAMNLPFPLDQGSIKWGRKESQEKNQEALSLPHDPLFNSGGKTFHVACKNALCGANEAASRPLVF